MKLRLLGYFDKNFGNDVMTRAEFCQLFNNIIGRNDMGLTALDQNGNEYEVTPAVLPVLVTATRTVTVVSSAVYAASAKEKVVYGLSFRQNDLREKDQTQHSRRSCHYRIPSTQLHDRYFRKPAAKRCVVFSLKKQTRRLYLVCLLVLKCAPYSLRKVRHSVSLLQQAFSPPTLMRSAVQALCSLYLHSCASHSTAQLLQAHSQGVQLTKPCSVRSV